MSSDTPSNSNSAPNPKLLVLSGAGKIYKLHKERIVLGSVVSADVRLTGNEIAPIHAVIELGGADSVQAMIFDLASETGVTVNGQKVLTHPLKTGDEIGVGVHQFRFSIEDVSQISSREVVKESEGRKLFLNPGEDLAPLLLQDEREVFEIFDYRPTSQRALEVVMSWSNTILDVEHFVRERQVTVGNAPGSDFGVPPVLSTSQFSIITKKGEDYILNLDAQMKGVVQRQGRLERVEQIRAQSTPSPMGTAISLTKNDFAKIGVGEVDFYLSFTAAPPRLKTRKLFERDPFFFKVLMSSVLLTALTIAALMNIQVPQTLEAEEVPERIATILYQPEKYSSKPKSELIPAPKAEEQTPEEKTPEKKVEPKPQETVKLDINPNPAATLKPVPKEMNVGKETAKGSNKAPKNDKGKSVAQNESKEGRGARAKGNEGTRGKKNAPVVVNQQPQDKASRPSPQGGEGRGGDGRSQVIDEGNVDLLKGASSKIQNLLGNSAANLGKGGEKLQGYGAFATQGKGGLALSGDGKGGGGDAASLGGLSDKGKGGGRVGTGRGATGDGSGIIGGKARVAIRSGGPEEAVIMGAIDADAVEAALLAHRDEFRLCYEREINAETPNLAGRVGTSFVIGSSGRVTQAGIESTSLKNANVERCVLTVIKRIDFPIPRGAGIVQVSYPFKFNAVGR